MLLWCIKTGQRWGRLGGWCISTVRDPGFFEFFTRLSLGCGLCPHLPNSCWRSRPRIHIQEPEGQEERRRAHPLPLKTVSSTCIALTRTQTYGHHADTREIDKYGLCSGEKCAQLNVRLISEQSEEWNFDKQRAVFNTDLVWPETQVPLPRLTSIPRTKDTRRVSGPDRNSSQLVYKCRLLRSAFLGSSFRLSLYEPSKHLMYMHGFHLAS